MRRASPQRDLCSSTQHLVSVSLLCGSGKNAAWRPASITFPHADAVFAMAGLLLEGKPDFEAIRQHARDEFSQRALSLVTVPSQATLRQRIDQLAGNCEAILREESGEMVGRHAPEIFPGLDDWIPLDVSPFDNSGTKKSRCESKEEWLLDVQGFGTGRNRVLERRYGLARRIASGVGACGVWFSR